MFSTKGRYAIRFMIDVAEQPAGAPIPLDDVARRQEISKKYLENVVKSLVAARLVRGVSGKGGGYLLLRRPEEYTVGEILKVAEGTLTSVACLEENAPPCPRAAFCKTLPMWKAFDALVYEFFASVTIADLVDGKFSVFDPASALPIVAPPPRDGRDCPCPDPAPENRGAARDASGAGDEPR